MEEWIMTIKEFKNSDMCKKATKVTYYDIKGVNISNKLSIILDLLQIIGTSHNADGSIDVDVDYIE
jgi:hypothetical protein